jgi:arginyl-tRNA synthetase
MDFKNTSFKDDEDISLAKTFMFYPDIIFDSCENNAPYLVNQYLYRLASEFHYFYNHCRIIDEGKLSTDRFKLILLTRIVLKNALDILKISAPQKM